MPLSARLLIFSPILLLFAACTESSGESLIFCPDCQIVNVIGVVDGDTIDTSVGLVRFFGVDTPERGDICFAEATEFTRVLAGGNVRLEDGPRLEDSNGRRLAYVYDSYGYSIDAQLVVRGLAKAWTEDGQHRDELIALQAEAESSYAGCLWATEQRYSPTEVDFRIARRQVDPNGGTRGAGLNSRFDDYAAIWVALVSLRLRDETETSFTSFVRSINESTQLTSQAVLAIELLMDLDARSDDRISAPRSEEDATVSCRTALVAARSRFGSLTQFLPNDCHKLWIDFQVAQQTGDTNDNWITWLTKRFGTF